MYKDTAEQQSGDASEARTQTEEAIINEIIEKRQHSSYDDIQDKLEHGRGSHSREGLRATIILEYGSKILALKIDFDSNQFSTFLTNTDNHQGRKENETTLLYKAAAIMMKRIADQHQKSFGYKLFTPDKKMVEWSNDSGQKIFNWEKKESSVSKQEGGDVVYYSYHATIRPEDDK